MILGFFIALLKGFFCSMPIILIQSYLYILLDNNKKKVLSPIAKQYFLFFVAVYTIILFIFPVLPCSCLLYINHQLVFYILLIISSFILLELSNLLLGKYGLAKIEFQDFIFIFSFVGVILYELIKFSQEYYGSFFFLIGIILGMFFFYFLMQSLFYFVLTKHCSSKLKITTIIIVLSSIVGSIFQLLSDKI